MKNPFGLQTVTPYMTAKNVQSVIEFLQNIFSATLREGTEYKDDGTMSHAEVTIDESVIMIGKP